MTEVEMVIGGIDRDQEKDLNVGLDHAPGPDHVLTRRG
jgi:hypothetical protein